MACLVTWVCIIGWFDMSVDHQTNWGYSTQGSDPRGCKGLGRKSVLKICRSQREDGQRLQTGFNKRNEGILLLKTVG